MNQRFDIARALCYAFSRANARDNIWKDSIDMRIAIPYYEGLIFQHFGHAPQFKVYEIENKQVLMEMVVESQGSGHAAVSQFLASMDVRVVICGNIGEGAMQALQDEGIVFYGGVTGSADDAITALIAGGLAYDPNIKCEHHHDHDCGCGGDCGGDCGDCGGDCGSCGGCH